MVMAPQPATGGRTGGRWRAGADVLRGPTRPSSGVWHAPASVQTIPARMV
ncbi:hypothetical protein SXCC_03995 [Gluconacetobacter sp. SXCC-1]|nr:hypothetical protein SXCC_03995 [Gluconacetobacter sp. SXCC-1]